MSTIEVTASILRWVLLVMFFGNVASFTRALQRGFTRPDGVRPGMRWMGALALLTTGIGTFTLWRSYDIPLVRAGVSALLLSTSQWLFRAAISATRVQPLSLAFSRDVPSHLNRTGPYRRVRHPFYTAYFLTWLGASVATAHWAALSAALIMAALYTTAAVREERKFIGSPLADVYRDYQRATGMFFPRISPIRPNPQNHTSHS